MKTAYEATFANGETITRNSERSYSHAYRIECARAVDTGFAASAQLAEKAARAAYGFHFYSTKFRQGTSQARSHVAALKKVDPILSLEVVAVNVKVAA